MTIRDWLAQHPPPDDAFTQSAAGVAARVNAGEEFLPAVWELLDEYGVLSTEQQRRRALADRPAPTGNRRYDAFLGALAEHLAARDGFERPAWACQPDRFLDQFWFVSAVPGFRALAIAESPAAFRRRGIFVSRGALQRC